MFIELMHAVIAKSLPLNSLNTMASADNCVMEIRLREVAVLFEVDYEAVRRRSRTGTYTATHPTHREAWTPETDKLFKGCSTTLLAPTRCIC